MSPIHPRRTTTKDGRFYTWRIEEGKYYSATTIIKGGLPWPPGPRWGAKFVATFSVDNYDKLGALLAPDAAGNVDRQGAIDWLKASPYRDRDKKGALGTLFHEAAEAYILDKPMPEWSAEVRPRMEQFLRFHEEWRPEYSMVEAEVYNRKERYAGTLDGICTLGGRRVLIDYKTGSGVYGDMAIQLAAYRYAEFIGAPDGSEVPMPDVDACVVLHIPDKGEYQLIEVQADAEVFQFFLYIREVYRWFNEGWPERVLLGPFPSTLESADLDDQGGADTPGHVMEQMVRESAADNAPGLTAGVHIRYTGEGEPRQLGISTVARGQTDLPEGY